MGRVAGPALRRAAFVLSPLQRQILDVVGGLSEAARFALAGGAALILRGTVRRDTNDECRIDFAALRRHFSWEQLLEFAAEMGYAEPAASILEGPRRAPETPLSLADCRS